VPVTVAPDAKPGVSRPAATPESLISDMWQQYLVSKHENYSANAGTPNPMWLASEQARWPMYDLAGFYLPDGAEPEVLSVRPTSVNTEREYEIVTRFVSPARLRADAAPSTILTMTVYAVRDSDQWVLANALPRKTAAWPRHRVGQITYFVEPGLAFDSTRARHAATFIDSLAAAFGVPRLTALDYYVTSSVDAAMAILGVQYPQIYGPHGGFSKAVNRQVFSGIPALGENYRHELTHVVLLPLLQGHALAVVTTEGVATWLGGTEGEDFTGSVRKLAAYLSEHPSVTLDAIVGVSSVPQYVRYTGGAVLCAMLFEQGGTAAIKEFLQLGPDPDALRAALSRMLGRPWPSVVSDWRAKVAEIAAAGPSGGP
jgi:hypothetical protein